MADTKGTKELTEEEYESLAPSDRAHYDIKGRLGDGSDPGDTESTKRAREVAFGDASEKDADAEPDPSSVKTTKSPEPKGADTHKEATGEDDGGNPDNRKKSTGKKGKSSDR